MDPLAEDEALARQVESDGQLARALSMGEEVDSPKQQRTWSDFFGKVRTQAEDMAKQAQDMAKHAQELATIQAEKAAKVAAEATKVANEKASVLVKHASELREKYDVELAASVLMTSIGVPSSVIGANSNSDISTPNSANGGSAVKRRVTGKNPLQLDLDYITENVIAMAFPYDPRKPGSSSGGNDINAVSNFLRKNHQGHYMVWNISEEAYDSSLFSDQVLEYKFPGHPAPPLGLLFKICTSVESWLDADEENVAIVHCLTGKGRTAALVACILTWLGEFSSPMDALQYVAERKGISVEYLTIPSQRRYVQYFSNMLDGVKPRSEPLLLRRVIINSIPVFGENGTGPDNTGCCPYLQLFKGGKLIATATPPDNDAVTRGVASTSEKKMQLKWVQASEGCVSFSIDCAVQGDILLRCRHAEPSGARVSMFRAAFHTGYAPSGVLRLTKAQLDGSVSDPRFPDDFFIDLIFAPIEKSTAFSVTSGSSTEGASVPSNAIGIVGEPSDSGLMIDASSADRYEMTLHRDTRFWEAVAARKSKSKKRRSRKFVSSTTDQFSISDDNITSPVSRSGGGSSISTTATSAAASSAPAAAVSGMSDLELIMQLARAEEEDGLGNDDDADEPVAALAGLQTLSSRSPLGDTRHCKADTSPASTTTSLTSINSAASLSAAPAVAAPRGEAELQALEDLEKELGLGDLNLFSDMQFGDANSSPRLSGEAKNTNMGVSNGDDDLDELEKYLQSISK